VKEFDGEKIPDGGADCSPIFAHRPTPGRGDTARQSHLSQDRRATSNPMMATAAKVTVGPKVEQPRAGRPTRSGSQSIRRAFFVKRIVEGRPPATSASNSANTPAPAAPPRRPQPI